jgi:hypothetical protein
MTRFIARAMVTTFSLAAAGGAVAQVAPASPPPQAPAAAAQVPLPILQDTGDSRQTRQRLNEILRQYPPAVGEVLRLDHSLLLRPDYLAAYPALGAFLAQHPEIIRNPSFFFGAVFDRDPPDARSRTINMFENVLGGAALFTAGMAVLGMLAWLIRQIIEHRKWLRASRAQTDVHTKLLDRLTSNEDLLAYIQTPAGRRFLEAAPSPVEAEPRPMGAPVGRILWSIQAGIVLIALGMGLWLVQRNAFEELAQGIYFLSMVALALGIGFIASAGAAYILSERFGLLTTRKAPRDA